MLQESKSNEEILTSHISIWPQNVILLSEGCPLDRWSGIRGTVCERERVNYWVSSPLLWATFMVIGVLEGMSPIPLKTEDNAMFGAEMLHRFRHHHLQRSQVRLYHSWLSYWMREKYRRFTSFGWLEALSFLESDWMVHHTVRWRPYFGNMWSEHNPSFALVFVSSLNNAFSSDSWQ